MENHPGEHLCSTIFYSWGKTKNHYPSFPLETGNQPKNTPRVFVTFATPRPPAAPELIRHTSDIVRPDEIEEVGPRLVVGMFSTR